MKIPKMLTALTALTILTACDYAEQADFKNERNDRTYRAAMDDYRAGRLDAAVKGLTKVCESSPGNASARFQLACLLQDDRKDYQSAYCAYREYLVQHPDSEKSKIARERMLECERRMAETLADKYGLNAAAADRRTVDDLRAACDRSEKRNAKLTKDLDAAMRRVNALVREVDRLKGLIRGETETADPRTLPTDEIAAAKALLTADDETPSSAADDLSAAKALLLEADDDAPMLAQPPDAKERRDAERTAAQAAEKQAAEKQTAEATARPKTYVVQEGDSLYRIALRFYGRKSAWSLIRNANKATISTDGRIRAGQVIVLPDE